jgi:Na+-translocating ferredoxin:NAD+ oxidoreductase RNF subunit RnfB
VLSPLSIPDRIERLNKVEETLQLLPGKECGVCGSPDCQTLAEDVVDGKATLDDCIFFHNHRKKMGVQRG